MYELVTQALELVVLWNNRCCSDVYTSTTWATVWIFSRISGPSCATLV